MFFIFLNLVCERGGIGKRWQLSAQFILYVGRHCILFGDLGGALIYLNISHRERMDFISFIGSYNLNKRVWKHFFESLLFIEECR